MIRGLNPDLPKNSTSLRIPVSNDNPFPVLDGRESRVYTLRVAEIEGAALDRMPPAVRDRLGSNEILLEELLMLGEYAFLRFAFSAAHEIGGLRRAVSRRYTGSQIVCGQFERRRRRMIIEPEPFEPVA